LIPVLFPRARGRASQIARGLISAPLPRETLLKGSRSI